MKLDHMKKRKTLWVWSEQIQALVE